MENLNRLAVFKAVMDTGSFSAAGRSLATRKSNISRSMAALESELGVQLLRRTTRQVQPTHAGQELYRQIRGALLQINHAVDDLKARETSVEGTIRISAPPDIGECILPTLLAEFRELHPRVVLEVILTAEPLNLIAHSIDIAIKAGVPEDSTALCRKIGRAALCLVAAPRLLEGLKEPLRPDTLHILPALHFNRLDQTGVWRIRNTKGLRKVRISPVTSSNSFRMLHAMALAGTGLALLPRFMCERDLRSDHLREPLPGWTGEEHWVYMLMPHHRETSLRIRLFADFLHARLRSYFAAPG